MRPEDSIPVSDLARRTRTVVERLEREPRARLTVLKNSRPVAVISGIEADRAAPSAGGRVREDLARKRHLIETLARAYGAISVRLFGSAARGEERADSDVDFMVEFEPGRSLLDLIGLQNDLADALGRKVDVVTPKGAGARVLKGVLKDSLRLV